MPDIETPEPVARDAHHDASGQCKVFLVKSLSSETINLNEMFPLMMFIVKH